MRRALFVLAVAISIAVLPTVPATGEAEFPPAGSSLVCSYDYYETEDRGYRGSVYRTATGSCTRLETGITYSSYLDHYYWTDGQHYPDVWLTSDSGDRASYALVWDRTSAPPVETARELVFGYEGDDPLVDTAYPHVIVGPLYGGGWDPAREGELLGTGIFVGTEKGWRTSDPNFPDYWQYERVGRLVLQFTAPTPYIPSA